MDSPQYFMEVSDELLSEKGFKPYYKWIVLNTWNINKAEADVLFGF